MKGREQCLAYVSTTYAMDGIVREEYARRLELAISDALALGISQNFIEQNLDPFINQKKELRPISTAHANAAASKPDSPVLGQSGQRGLC